MRKANTAPTAYSTLPRKILGKPDYESWIHRVYTDYLMEQCSLRKQFIVPKNLIICSTSITLYAVRTKCDVHVLKLI